MKMDAGAKKVPAPERKIGFWVLRYRWQVLWISLALVSVSVYGLRSLMFFTDYRDFFDKDDPHLLAFETIGKTYTYNDNALLVLAPKNREIFTRENLAIVDEATRSAWLTPYSTRVDSLTNFPFIQAHGDDLTVRILENEIGRLSNAEQLEQARNLALSEPQIAHRLVSPSGRVAAVFVNIYLPRKKETELAETVAYVRSLAERIRGKHPEMDVFLGGSIMLSDVLTENSRRDLQWVFPAMCGAVVLVLGAVLRSFWAVVSALLTVGLSVASAFGLAGWMGTRISPLSAIAPTLILTVVLANGVHVLVHVLGRMRAGEDKLRAIGEALGTNAVPVTVNNVAAAAGFSSLGFNASPAFRDMGYIVIMGLGAGCLLTLFFLPILLSVTPVRVKLGQKSGPCPMDRFGGFIVARRGPLFWGMMGLVLTLALHVPRLEANEKFSEYFDKLSAFRKDADFIDGNLAGLSAIEYSLEAGEKRGIVQPEYLSTLDRLAEWYGKQPGVVFVDSLSGVVKRINQTMHGDDADYYRVPDGRNLAAQYLTLYEMSLPAGFDLDTRIKYDESATRFTVVLRDMTNAELLDLERRSHEWIGKNAPSGMHSRGASPMVLFAHLTRESADRMLSGGLWALFLISALLIVPLRSLKYGLISLVPNLVPSLMAYGLWGLLGKPLGLAGSAVATMSLGMVVNDNVHFLCQYARARREMGLSPADAARFALKVAGAPMWSASLILALGFLMLSFSGFAVNATLGLLTAVTIAFALVADFFFLPPLLLKVEEWTDEKNRF